MNNYFKNFLYKSKLLSKSIIIKVDEIRKHFDYHFYIKYGKIPPKIEESKYYLNLSGKIFKSDPIVYYKDNELTREFLLENSYIKNNLLKFEKEYDKLISENKLMTTYINGCLLDYDIDELIKFDNYKILHYRKDLVNENEDDLINEIQEFTNIFFTNYFNKNYLMDELYLPAVLNIYRNNLYLFILTTRFKNIASYKTFDDLLYLQLDSYKQSSDFKAIFNKTSLISLRNDVNYMKKFLGTNKIHEKLYDYIDKTLVSISPIFYSKNIPEILEGNINDIKKEYVEYKEKFYTVKEKAINSITEVLTKEDINALEHEYKEIDKNIMDKIKINLLTKAEKIKANIAPYPGYFDNKKFILNNIISLLLKTNEPNKILNIKLNNKFLSLTMHDLKDVFLLAIINDIGIDNFTLTIENTITKDVYYNKIYQNTYYGNYITSILDFLINTINIDEIYNTNDFKILEHNISFFNKVLNLLITNVTDEFLKSDIEIISKFILNKTIININKNNIIKNPIFYSIPDLSKLTINDIINIFNNSFNLNIDTLSENMDNYTKIIKKFYNNFTSYTVQLLNDVSVLNTTIFTSKKNDLLINYLPSVEKIESTTEINKNTNNSLLDKTYGKDYVISQNYENPIPKELNYYDNPSYGYISEVITGVVSTIEKTHTPSSYKVKLNIKFSKTNSINKAYETVTVAYNITNKPIIIEDDEISIISLFVNSELQLKYLEDDNYKPLFNIFTNGEIANHYLTGYDNQISDFNINISDNMHSLESYKPEIKLANINNEENDVNNINEDLDTYNIANTLSYKTENIDNLETIDFGEIEITVEDG